MTGGVVDPPPLFFFFFENELIRKLLPQKEEIAGGGQWQEQARLLGRISFLQREVHSAWKNLALKLGRRTICTR